MSKKRKLLWLSIPLMAAVLASMVTFVVIGANPLSPVNNEVISAAYQKVNGMLRLVNGPADINPSETYISWNQQGPAGPQGPAGATGATGNFSGIFTGNTTFTGASNNFTGNFTGTNTFLNSIKLVGSNLSSGSPLQFVYRGDTVVNVMGAGTGGYARLNLSDIQLNSANGIYFAQTGAGFQASLYGSNNSYSHISVYNGTASSEVMRFVQYLGNQWAQFTRPPKFSTNSVTGPTNNVTPVTWIPILLTDNTTAYIPAYK